MKTKFLSEDFLLQNEAAKKLYHNYASLMPIVDYHCHLAPKDIAEDRRFKNLTEAWLEGDHYKWRAMRANGVAEKYITGDTFDLAKFQKWAETVPATLRNPLYHWTHLELKNYFGITELLNVENAEDIYIKASALLQKKEFSVRNLLRKMKVEVLCTTDDPTDSLEYHKQLQEEGFEIKVLPTFRPDMALNIELKVQFWDWINKLEKVCNTPIASYSDLLKALKQRHDFFHKMGCRLSDHGLETFYAKNYSEGEIEAIFQKAKKETLSDIEILKYKSALLFHLAMMNSEKGWVQQFHVGAIRNTNSEMYHKLGANTGYDSIGDYSYCESMQKFLDRLNSENALAKTIFYNLHPKDNEMMAAMAANFNDGAVGGKMQYGSAWWFLDQKDGIEKQLNVLSNFGLLNRFVGMVTDSRSFLSYPRHEYFRRILCNLIGTDVTNGELPEDYELLGKLVNDVCYNNAKGYFDFSTSLRGGTTKQTHYAK